MHIDMSRMHVCKEICTFCICVELSVYRHSVYCSYLYIYIYAHENGQTYAFICECSYANLFFLEEGNIKDLCVLHIVFFFRKKVSFVSF